MYTGGPASALRALRRAYPGHHFVLATPAYLGGLLPLIGGVDEVLDVSGPGPVPYESPDIAVNLHGSGPESIQALRRIVGRGALCRHDQGEACREGDQAAPTTTPSGHRPGLRLVPVASL